MSLTERQRDALLSQIAKDVRRIANAVCPDTERGATTRKKDPKRLYGGDNG